MWKLCILSRDTTFMLSGIASLEWKWVKNAGQRLKLLFIGTQKSAILACNLCTTGWEKGHTPFVKVVEDQEIFNFAIDCLGHFCSTFWSFGWSNRATWKHFGHPALQSVPRNVGCQAVCHRRRPHRGPGMDAEAPREPRSTRRGIGRHAHRLPPPSRSRHASTVTAQPSYASRWAPPRRPYLDSCGRRAQWSWLLPHSTSTYKVRRSSPACARARPRHPAPPAVHHWGRAVNSRACLVSQLPKPLGTSARIHRSCPGHLFPRLGCQLAGATAPAAAAVWLRRTCPPATSPPQVNT
jgi:hypothetical protein